MNTFKRLFSAAVALTLGLGIGMPVSATANNESIDTISYDSCDVNHDGSVDIMDVIRLNKYLGGIEAVLHTDYLDANGNKIVDIADTEKVLAAVVETSYTWSFFDITSTSSIAVSDAEPEDRTVGDMTELPVDSDFELLDTTSLAESDTSATRQYIRFRTNQPTTLSTYSLTTTYNSNSKDFPLRSNSDYSTSAGESETGVVRLVRSSEQSNTNNTGYSTYHGTGFIIDDHRIVTAAHCIYHDTDGDNIIEPNEFYSDLQIQMCNSNGVVTSTTYNVKEIHIPSDYLTGGYEYDYALLTVSTSLPSTTYTHYEIGTPIDITSNSFKSINLFISGFAQDVDDLRYVYTSKGHGNNSTNSNMLIYTNHDWNGLSGSPVYTATKYKVGNNNWVSVYTALAVNTRKYTSGNGGLGPAFNEFLLTFYRQGSTNVGY